MAAKELSADLAKKEHELATLRHDSNVKTQHLEEQIISIRTILREKDERLNEVQRLNISLEVEIQQYRCVRRCPSSCVVVVVRKLRTLTIC
jgi:hypothetical protein